jgi:hypothetical protein
MKKKCKQCRAKVAGYTAPDPCLGFLPGVSWACCGHGHVSKAYVVIGGAPYEGRDGRSDWVTLRGTDALAFFAMVARGEHPKEAA